MLSSGKARGRSNAGRGDQDAIKKSAVSRSQILDAAAALFRDNGYAATTLRQIADAADMKAGSIYYHFASKDDILDEVLEIGEKAVLDSVRHAISVLGANTNNRKRIECAIRGHLEALLAKSVYSSANIRIFGQLPKHVKRRHRKLRSEYAALWDGLFVDAKKSGDIRANVSVVPLRMFVLGALNWTVEWFEADHHAVAELAQRTALFIFEGIENRSRRQDR